jgi:hypothetical protein
MKIQQTLEREGISFIADPGGGIGVRLDRTGQTGWGLLAIKGLLFDINASKALCFDA